MGTTFHPGWEAGLELHMGDRGGVTRLTHMRHWGPLRVQRPFYPGADGACHLYLLHPPGGMVTGDSLEVDVRLTDGAAGLLTTPSAGKIYRGNNTLASQRQQVAVKVAGNSVVEWLPLETIVFDGARGELCLRVDLENSSQCALWDIVCLGRPASGETFTNGYLNQRVEVWRDGVPLYVEMNRFQGGGDMLGGRWGMAGHVVAGTFLVSTQPDDGVIASLRDLLDSQRGPGELLALSPLGGLLAIRYLGDSAERCRQYFAAAWQYLKPLLWRREFVEPRIWRT